MFNELYSGKDSASIIKQATGLPRVDGHNNVARYHNHYAACPIPQSSHQLRATHNTGSGSRISRNHSGTTYNTESDVLEHRRHDSSGNSGRGRLCRYPYDASQVYSYKCCWWCYALYFFT